MRSKKHIALCGIMIIFVIIAVCMNYYIKENAGQGGVCNSYGICINEVCSSYFPSSFAETQPPSDWIELYNFSDESKNLSEYYLSDDKNDLYKYNLPAVELLPGSYYVIHSEYAEMEAGAECLNFRIKAQGETLYLSDRRGVIDAVNVPKMETNTAWSRLTDAGHIWGTTELTYCFSNNQAEPVLEKIDAPVFSEEGGFYADEFELELKAPHGNRIYYTLDGSEPDDESILYEGPILIRDTSADPNLYSARNDLDPERDAPPENPVEKIMVVRAVAVDEDGRTSNIVTNSYIVGREDAESHREMYTVSLVTDPYNLFDSEEGIYILGKKYDGCIPAEGESLDDTEANYRIRGQRSERPASIEIFDENGNCILDREVGIRVHGNTTRRCTQKSFSVYAREMYDGSDTVEGLFGTDSTVHKFLLYTNREGTKLRDALIAKTLSDRNMATQSMKYCNVFLDGEYWGIYLIEEIYDDYYFKNHYGIEADNIQINYGASPPDVIEYLNSVSDKSEAAVYEKLCQMIDVQSFIDYYAAMLYLNDNDWLGYNARCYRSIEPGSGENEDGKWRWGVWDVEITMYNAYQDTFREGNAKTWQEDQLAQALMEHEAFRQQFVITYMDLYNNIWREDNILPLVLEMSNDIEASYEMYMERFHAGRDINEYYSKIESFFMERKDFAFEHVKNEFELGGAAAWIVILSNKGGAASFRVNTSIIDMPETWWQGVYFPEYPVELAVEEVYDGNEFLGWYTEDDELVSTDYVITVNLTEETNIINAKFKVD